MSYRPNSDIGANDRIVVNTTDEFGRPYSYVTDKKTKDTQMMKSSAPIGAAAAAAAAPVINNPAAAAGSGSRGTVPVVPSSESEDFDLNARFTDMMDQIYDLQNANNARMIENAERQMRFQEESQAKAMAFNAEQARIDREWQQMMSNTSHQREVQDLIAAGLNPILSANGGAPVGSGATSSVQAMSGANADVDTSSFSNFLGNIAGAMASMHNAEVNAQAALGAASINAAASKAIAGMQLSQPSSWPAFLSRIMNSFSDGVSSGQTPTFFDLIKYAMNYGMSKMK